MIVKLLIEHHLEFLSLKEGCIGSSKSTHVKMPHCWKSRATAQSTIAGNRGCNGGFMWRAYKYVMSNGYINSEECYPYTGKVSL